MKAKTLCGLLTVLLLTFAAVPFAFAESATWDNWDLQYAPKTRTLSTDTDYDTFGFYVSVASIEFTNTSSNHNYQFQVLDASNDGWSIVFTSGGNYNFSDRGNLYLYPVDGGSAGSAAWSQSEINATTAKLTNDGTTLKFYADGEQVYQTATLGIVNATHIDYRTLDALNDGGATPAFFTGTASVVLTEYSGFDSAILLVTLLPIAVIVVLLRKIK